MSWHLGTRVNVSIILRKKIHIMEDKAVPREILESLHKTHIHWHGSIEFIVVGLILVLQRMQNLILDLWANKMN